MFCSCARLLACLQTCHSCSVQPLMLTLQLEKCTQASQGSTTAVSSLSVHYLFELSAKQPQLLVCCSNRQHSVRLPVLEVFSLLVHAFNILASILLQNCANSNLKQQNVCLVINVHNMLLMYWLHQMFRVLLCLRWADGSITCHVQRSLWLMVIKVMSIDLLLQ